MMGGRAKGRAPTASQAVLALAALVTGASLVVALLAHTSLALPLALFGLLAVVTAVLWCMRAPAAARAEAARRGRYGLAAGLAATLAYDAVRLLVVEGLRLHVHPFDTFVLFGQLIVGGPPRPLAWVVGTAYHYANGVLFSVAYMMLLAGRAWWLGILWGLGLECLMLVIYPGWLNLRLVMVEFTVMSLSGHLAYGATLGLLGQRLTGRWPVSARRFARLGGGG